MNKYYIHTFDVFDTCLSRTCGDPRDLFYIMAYRVIGTTCTDTQANDFRYIRVQGEIEASKKLSSKATIFNIYEECDFSAFTSLPKETLISIEMELEKRFLQPIKNTLDLVTNIHNSGACIIYISDMYLPSTFLKEVLLINGFWDENDKLYVSCECGYTKSNGTLYEYVKKEEGLSNIKWIHHGDNYHSDIIVPRKKLIRTKHNAYSYTPLENFYRTKNLNSSNHAMLMYVGALRSVRLATNDTPISQFAVDLIAAVYVPYVYSILSDASERGIKRLYFLSRDGYIFLKIAEVFSDVFPQIELRYLYVSRKSLYLPSLKNINKDSLKSLLTGTNTSNIKERMDNLQIDLGDKYYKLVSDGVDPTDLLISPPYYRLISDQVTKQKHNAIKYFEQEKLATHSNDVAIVDLRGTRRCQKCISSILSENGYNEVYAYYLEGAHNRITPDRYDDYKAFIFADSIATNSIFKGLESAKFVLEHYCSLTSFQRTSSYKQEEDRILPTFDDEVIDEYNDLIMQTNISLCILVASKLKSMGIMSYSSEMLNVGLSGLASFMTNPDKYLLKALVNINSTQTKHKTKYLVKRLTISSILKHEIAWYEGSIKYTFGGCGLHAYNRVLPIIKKLYRWIQ